MSVARWWSALSPVKSPRKHRRRVRPWPSLYGQIQELETRALLTPGALDTTFGGGGSLITTFTTGDDVGKGVAIQSDGKIVVVGTCPGVTNNPSSSTDFALVRYNTDGSLDTTFGNGGKVRTNVFQFDNAFGVTVQPDGKIIVVGETFTGSNFDFAVLRYNANGSLDGTWGFAGIVTTDFGFGDDGAQAAAVQSDGKVVVVGAMFNSVNFDFAIARYNTDGTLDTTFAFNGKGSTGVGSGNDFARKVLIRSDGRILVGGEATNGGAAFLALAQYTTFGGLDTSYGLNGFTTRVAGNGNMTFKGLANDSLGRTLIAGTITFNGNEDFMVARVNGDGSADTSFGGTGTVTTDLGSLFDEVGGMTVQTDSSIVVVGRTVVNSVSDFAIVRYQTNGTLDSSFGTSGITITPMGPGSSVAEGVALQAGGKIVVVGSADNVFNGVDFAVARYEGVRTFPTGDPNTIVRMYRAYNPNAAYHFFTISFTEFLNAVQHGYIDETSGRQGFGVRAGQADGTVPLHRLYNPNTGRHYYTVADGERDILVGLGWIWEKDEGFIYPSQVGGTVEIYRLYNNISGTHLYTESPAQRDAILAQFPGIWVQHASVGFAYIIAASQNTAATLLNAVAEPLPVQMSTDDKDTDAAFADLAHAGID